MANEPELAKYGGKPHEADDGAVAYFTELLEFTKAQDPQKRPVTIEMDATTFDFHQRVNLDLINIHLSRRDSAEHFFRSNALPGTATAGSLIPAECSGDFTTGIPVGTGSPPWMLSKG